VRIHVNRHLTASWRVMRYREIDTHSSRREDETIEWMIASDRITRVVKQERDAPRQRVPRLVPVELEVARIVAVEILRIVGLAVRQIRPQSQATPDELCPCLLHLEDGRCFDGIMDD